MDRNEFHQLFRDYFTFTRSEQKGMFVLCILFLISIIVKLIASSVHLGDPADPHDFLSRLQKLPSGQVKRSEPEKTLFAFNPNTISGSALDSLQIPSKVAVNLQRYRQKGGVFRKKDDLRRIFGMSDSVFDIIRPYIILDSAKKAYKPPAPVNKVPVMNPDLVPVSKYEVKIDRSVELNTADSVELLQLPGIGPVFAGRIVRYRKILGGFSSVDQLSEVYGMKPDLAGRLNGKVKADRSLIVQIRINFADYYTLDRHPYISGALAKSIIDWRSAHGPFGVAEELVKARLMDSLQYLRLEPYLSCR